MDLQFYGANCIALTYKGTRLVIDDNLTELGGKSVLKADDVALFSGEYKPSKADLKLLIDRPGEYEVGELSITGVAARAHMDESGTKATIYKVTGGDLSVVFAGHIYPELKEAQLEAIGRVDVLLVPVGGMGYTLDSIGALKLVKELEPKLVVPTHYADKDLSFPVPQQDLEQALKDFGMEPKEAVTRLKLKAGDLSEGTQLQILQKS